MGKQAKLKAQRRAMREAKRLAEAERVKTVKVDESNPPDLGVYASETVQTADVFGRR